MTLAGRRTVATVLTITVGLLAGCRSEPACPSSASATACADLVYQGRSYDEWREVEPSGVLQELGDATYPACNATERCEDPVFGEFRATDVWMLEGADPADALIGLREGTHTYVIFVRQGADPPTVTGDHEE